MQVNDLQGFFIAAWRCGPDLFMNFHALACLCLPSHAPMKLAEAWRLRIAGTTAA
ncbi:hypothetical protein [Variovorax sp. EL159]|uniref:hypothetical protein n=1 Tax=Variovorax sp. EL159 TaxID=1566270 RepID=UPI0015A2FD88|nr:hypothetical protein [Variovorax sp. EL159]